MPVNDPTSGLPWWVNQGGQPGSGPPGQGASWLNYLAQMFGQGGQNPNAPAPNAQNMAMTTSTPNGGFAIPGPGGVQNASVRVVGDDDDHGTGDNPPVNPNPNPPPPPRIDDSVTMPPQPPGYLGSTGATGGVPVGSWNPQPTPGPMAGDPRPDAVTNRMTGNFGPALGPPPRPTPSPAAAPMSSRSPAVAGGATAAPRAAPMGGGPNDRFTTFQYNVPGSGGGQGGRNAPIYTALNLGSLFGGGAQGTPSQTPRPAVPGPMAANSPLISRTTGQPMPMSSADAAYGLPDARGAPYPYALGSPRRAAAIASAAKHSGYA
jgi:hypothetical protein